MATKGAKYLVVAYTPGYAIGGKGTGVSATAHDTKTEAEAQAGKTVVGGNEAYIFRLTSIHRRKPVPVEVEVVSTCEDAED